MYDVAVIGAGPAGCVASKMLAQEGFRTILIEKEMLPRDKPCAGGVTLNTCRLLKSLGYDIEELPFERFPNKARIEGFGAKISIEWNPWIAAITRRRSFDFTLAEMAIAEGCSLVQATSVKGVKNAGSYMKLLLGEKTISASFVLGADGVGSIVAKSVGIRENWKADELGIAICAEASGKFDDEMILDFQAIKGGYGWTFPLDRGANVGIGSFVSSRDLMRFRELMRKHASRFKIKFGEIKGHPLPLGKNRRLSIDRVILIGDAAGLVDAITGEGIYSAIFSAKTAVDSLKGGIEEASVDYQKRMSSFLQEADLKFRVGKLIYKWIKDVLWAMEEDFEIAKRFVMVVVGEMSFVEFWGWFKRKLPSISFNVVKRMIRFY